MPVEGFPDASRHKLCSRCQKWCEPDEGAMIEREISGPFSGLRSSAKRLAGLEPETRFMCHRCVKVRRYTKIVIMGTFVVLVAVALALGWLGVI